MSPPRNPLNAVSANSVRKRVREILGRLPEAQTVPLDRHLSLEVRKKRFGWFLDDHHGDGRLAINCKAQPKQRSRWLEALPDHAHIPKYVGHLGWVGFWVDTGDDIIWDSVEEALAAAYRMIAPKRLLNHGGIDV